MDFEIIIRFILAALLGGIVGAEREYRSKSAGFRTMILISVGACFFTHMSIQIGAPGNPDRIASNILTGIGFIGAGVIFRGANKISGITTAATIWYVASIGMGIGAGYYFAAGCASLIIIFVLAILPYLENVIDQMNQIKTYTISYAEDKAEQGMFEKMFTDCKLKAKKTGHERKDAQLTTVWEVQGKAKSHGQFAHAIEHNKLISSYEFYD